MKKAISLIIVLSFLLAGCASSSGSSLPVGGPALDRLGLEVHFIDVGQGDSILIRVSNGKNILIDGGPRGSGVANYLREQGVGYLDLMVSTHAHADHVGGLISVLRALPVAEVLDPALPHTTQTFEEYLTLIHDLGIPFTSARAGIVYDFGAILEVLGPEGEMSGINDSSVIIKMTLGDASFLFTGDAEFEAEQAVLKYDLSSDVLKVGHHGSRTSTSAEFLSEVNPSVAVICVGEGNEYGHPHPEVLERLSGVRVYRTDVHGNIIIRTDGLQIQIIEEESK